jgi:hypothetical protein
MLAHPQERQTLLNDFYRAIISTNTAYAFGFSMNNFSKKKKDFWDFFCSGILRSELSGISLLLRTLFWFPVLNDVPDRETDILPGGLAEFRDECPGEPYYPLIKPDFSVAAPVF